VLGVKNSTDISPINPAADGKKRKRANPARPPARPGQHLASQTETSTSIRNSQRTHTGRTTFGCLRLSSSSRRLGGLASLRHDRSMPSATDVSGNVVDSFFKYEPLFSSIIPG
jgi:hypothetical protein